MIGTSPSAARAGERKKSEKGSGSGSDSGGHANGNRAGVESGSGNGENSSRGSFSIVSNKVARGWSRSLGPADSVTLTDEDDTDSFRGDIVHQSHSLNGSHYQGTRGHNQWSSSVDDVARSRSLLTWVAVVIIGIAISGVSYAITLLLALLLEMKLLVADKIIHGNTHSVYSDYSDYEGEDNSDAVGFGSVALAAFSWVGLGLFLSGLAFCMVQFIAPLGAGSGLPETKGFLNGTQVKGLFSLRTLGVRALGVVMVVSSTIPVGREQPLMHIGAAISHIIIHIPPVWKLVEIKNRTEDAKEREERMYATIGAAAGISSAYGAPVGGVLYVFEELATFWDEKTTLKCFVTCLLAAALVTWIKLGGFLGDTFAGLVIFESGKNTLELGSWSVAEVPFFILLGLLAALSASIFTWMALRVTHMRRTIRLKLGFWSQLLDLVVVVVVVNFLFFMLPAAFPCVRAPNETESSTHHRRSLLGGDEHGGDHHRQFYQYNCAGGGYYNKLASLMLTGEEGALKHLYARDVDVFDPVTLVVFFFTYLIVATGVVGLQVPMGHFIPNMLSGAALGRLYGKLLKTWLQDTSLDISPGIYAQIGSAAQLSGFSRMTIALAVLLTEASGDVSLMIPMMIAMLFARGLAGLLLLPMDEVLLEIKHIVFLGSKPPRSLDNLIARDVMHTDFNVLNANCTIDEATDAINDTHAHQVRFPVVKSIASNAGSGFNHKMIGVIARNRLRERVRKVQLANSVCIDDHDYINSIDLTDGVLVLDEHPFTVSPDLSMPQVFYIFRRFGLRQIFVVGRSPGESERNAQQAGILGSELTVLGMLSRGDLVDPEHIRRANNAYGSHGNVVGIINGDDGDDPIIATAGNEAANNNLMRQHRTSSAATIDDLADELVEGDNSETVVAQERISTRAQHRSVADLFNGKKESTSTMNKKTDVDESGSMEKICNAEEEEEEGNEKKRTPLIVQQDADVAQGKRTTSSFSEEKKEGGGFSSTGSETDDEESVEEDRGTSSPLGVGISQTEEDRNLDPTIESTKKNN